MDSEGNNESNAPGYFNISEMHVHMQNCLLDDSDIQLDSYLATYKELHKFCHLTGSIFKFVKEEIESKSHVLRELKRQNPNEFATLKTMVKYEMESGLLEKESYTSGCRTLLRLHWGLEFIKMFLQKLYEMKADESTSTVGRQVYSETLGTKHPWYLRMAAHGAMCFLPSKKSLEDMLFGIDHDGSYVNEVPKMLRSADKVYNITDEVYRTNNLLALP